ncbi:hypothetical protein PGTUg99_011478 [Puccinia graminis f. sp. tritici]|uniref:Uncharacterized protein n=1 Tax=Puccinia graminis f. sp. tritici TaxID=56615 RepID=A0A5B0SK60_PUCGR|nr:hypothetical protein PGTUg99_011478 [Puccinia graminis f. sp. tritici]
MPASQCTPAAALWIGLPPPLSPLVRSKPRFRLSVPPIHSDTWQIRADTVSVAAIPQRHHVTQPLYEKCLRRPASGPSRFSPLCRSPRHSPLHRSPRRASATPPPPFAPATNLQIVPRQPSLSPVRSLVPVSTTIDIKPIVISLGPPSPVAQSPVARSPPVSPMRVNPEPEVCHPTPPPSVGTTPKHTTPVLSPPLHLNFLRTP